MYTGHIGLALAGKAFRPEAPLWVYLAAAFSPDLVETGLMLVGLQGVNDRWSHLVPGLFVVIPAAGIMALVVTRDARVAAVAVGLAAGHVAVDFVTSRYEVWSGGPHVGLELYTRPVLDFVVEVCVVTGGWWLYRRSLPAARRSTWPVWLLLVFLVALQAAFSFMRGAVV